MRDAKLSANSPTLQDTGAQRLEVIAPAERVQDALRTVLVEIAAD